MFRETWFGSFWRVFGPMDFHDCRVCDFALFYWGFWMGLVFWGGLKGWNFDPRGGFKSKVDNQDSMSWGSHFGGSARTKIMKFHDFKNAFAHCRFLIISCFWGAIVEVQLYIFIKKSSRRAKTWIPTLPNIGHTIAGHAPSRSAFNFAYRSLLILTITGFYRFGKLSILLIKPVWNRWVRVCRGLQAKRFWAQTSIYVVFGEELKSSTLGGPEGARKHVFLRARKTLKNHTNIVKSMVPGQDFWSETIIYAAFGERRDFETRPLEKKSYASEYLTELNIRVVLLAVWHWTWLSAK